MTMDIVQLLKDVRDGKITPEEASLRLRKEPYEDLGYAKVDHHRLLRNGAAEVIYGAGKTPEQILGIVRSLKKDTGCVLVTRVDDKAVGYLKENGEEVCHYPEARLCTVGKMPEPSGKGYIAVVSAGTSDMAVAEEAALTAEALGNRVVRIYDVGVAGLHRILSKMDELLGAKVVIAVAGMEGALVSVVGGLVDVPVIAVPTSVGYGASFEGLSALLAMMSTCASGVSVVNIDNGFGAGYLASRINQIGE
ncbi:MAG: nickel pincer cofactor biosynthesis protein LarB [Candidatus Methanomethylophilaceae archaeon]|jgi:hypothetical protein